MLKWRTVFILARQNTWDEDPGGEGSANVLIALDGDFNKAIEQVFKDKIDMPGQGYHTFHIRVMDENGTLGSTFDKTILVNQALSSRDMQQCKLSTSGHDSGIGQAETILALDGNLNQAVEKIFHK